VNDVLSSSNTKSEIREKAALCLSTGTHEFWVVDPPSRSASVARPGGETKVYGIGDHIPLTLLGGGLEVARNISLETQADCSSFHALFTLLVLAELLPGKEMTHFLGRRTPGSSELATIAGSGAGSGDLNLNRLAVVVIVRGSARSFLGIKG
jgi:hypothetical protein